MPRIMSSFALVIVALCSTAFAGPPWISIEYPANPHDAAQREAYLVVNTYHHERPTAMSLRGSAEGIVRGERRTIPLRFTSLTRTGSYSLTRQWPREGKWVLSIMLQQGEQAEAAALITLGADGTPAHVDVPTRRDGPWHVPRLHTSAEISTALAGAGEQGR